MTNLKTKTGLALIYYAFFDNTTSQGMHVSLYINFILDFETSYLKIFLTHFTARVVVGVFVCFGFGWLFL